MLNVSYISIKLEKNANLTAKGIKTILLKLKSSVHSFMNWESTPKNQDRTKSFES